MYPEDRLSQHFRLTPLQIAALKKLGISTIRDLLYHFPSRYDQGGAQSAISGLSPGSEATIFGTISKLETRRSWKRKIPVGEATLKDASGSIKIMWFHQPYLAKKFPEGAFVKAVGAVSGTSGKIYLANPHVEVADPVEAGLFSQPTSEGESAALFAVYPESRGVTSLWLRHAIGRVLKTNVLDALEDPVPEETRVRLHLPELVNALRSIHTPEKIAHAEAARKRFAFEEMFSIQVARAGERAENEREKSFRLSEASEKAGAFLSALPYAPTRAQERAITDILSDFQKPHPMARLLEGDVGSGKTLVAAASAYAVVTSRPPGRESGTLQVAYMAPTEILARQHFQSFIAYFEHLPINIGLITGSGCMKFPSKIARGKATNISRAQLLKWVANGEIAMLVGTHAIIQKSVKFQHLAYAIVDEQHRFGTKQRKALAHKGGGGRIFSTEDSGRSTASPSGRGSASVAGRKNPTYAALSNSLPHFLSMTATPIPRTLALTIYGDLDISVLDELPPGRAKITTEIIRPAARAAAYEKIRRELQSGRQAYVICPRINEPDPKNENALLAKSAKAEAARLQKDVFPEFKVGLLHGAMKPSEKESVMADFEAGKIDILVATSLVEVGVNVPNATAIAIEGAERFGLAQLHQLRGRVMRSSHPPICFLMPGSKSEISMQRLRALEKNDDGFALAEADLAARGAGDIFGRAQWGVSDIGMEALKNPRLIAAARTEAQDLIARDPSLSRHAALRSRVEKISRDLHAE